MEIITFNNTLREKVSVVDDGIKVAHHNANCLNQTNTLPPSLWKQL